MQWTLQSSNQRGKENQERIVHRRQERRLLQKRTVLDAAEGLNKVRPKVVSVGVLDISNFEESNFKEVMVEHWTSSKSK